MPETTDKSYGDFSNQIVIFCGQGIQNHYD